MSNPRLLSMQLDLDGTLAEGVDIELNTEDILSFISKTKLAK